MKYFYFTLLLFTLNLTLVAAQSVYKPGYVVYLNGDTLKGFIEFRQWDSNPNKISFKESINSDRVLKLTTNKIKYFNVNNLVEYQRYSGKMSMDATRTEQPAGARDTSFKVDTVFLKVLQKGRNITLYGYSDDFKPRYFFSENFDNKPVELTYRIYYDTQTTVTGNRTITENGYMRQLYTLATKYHPNDDGLISEIERSSYREDDLISITGKINGKNQKEIAAALKHRLSLHYYAGVGVNSSSTKPQNDLTTYGATSHSSVAPKILAGAYAFANSDTKRLEFRTELSVTGSSYQTSVNNLHVSIQPGTYAYSQIETAITPQVLYNIYNSDAFKFYLDAGVSVMYYIYSKDKFVPTGQTTSISNYYPLEHLMTSYPVKAGFIINNRSEFAFTYRTSNNIAYGNYNLHVQTFEVTFDYLFGK